MNVYPPFFHSASLWIISIVKLTIPMSFPNASIKENGSMMYLFLKKKKNEGNKIIGCPKDKWKGVESLLEKH